jgi:predicted metalloendopeptidase
MTMRCNKSLCARRIDASVDPCDDFYDFACGSFTQDVYPPDERVAVDTLTKLRDTIDAQVYALLVKANDDGAKDSLKLSKELFNSCLGERKAVRLTKMKCQLAPLQVIETTMKSARCGPLSGRWAVGQCS